MILIADSGSTKTDWCFVENGEILQQIFTAGINPFYQNETDIKLEIEKLVKTYKGQIKDITSIYFYGAGCSFPEKKALVSKSIGSYFFDTTIEVESDLLGAARALLLNNSGIACILGTGSNSCFYDGKSITNNVSPLGFILGDEGSGAVLARTFVSDCLKNQLPEIISTRFIQQYNLTPAEILENVYKKPFPNRYLAQFTRFLSENIDQESIRKLVFRGFVSFFERNVWQYSYQVVPTSFVGSIAWYFADILREAAKKSNVSIGEIVQSPMHGLVKFHE